MGKGSGVFCAMLFSCLLLTGCAENPTEDIVVNKNEGKLEQAIQRENKKDSDTSVPYFCKRRRQVSPFSASMI